MELNKEVDFADPKEDRNDIEIGISKATSSTFPRPV